MPRVPDKDWPEEWCEMVPEGVDTDGTKWNRCEVHNELVIGDAYICAAYQPQPYIEEVKS